MKLGGLDELDEDAAGVLGVHEVDPGVGRTPTWLVEEQPHALGPQVGARRVDVVHGPRHLLEPGTSTVEECRDGRRRRQRGQQLEPRARSVDVGAGASIASRTPCSSLTSSCTVTRPKVSGIERLGLVEVSDGHPDVVDTGDHEDSSGGIRCYVSVSWQHAHRCVLDRRAPRGPIRRLSPASEPVRHRRRSAYAHRPTARLPQGLLRSRPRRLRDQGGPGAGRRHAVTRSTT